MRNLPIACCSSDALERNEKRRRNCRLNQNEEEEEDHINDRSHFLFTLLVDLIRNVIHEEFSSPFFSLDRSYKHDQ